MKDVKFSMILGFFVFYLLTVHDFMEFFWFIVVVGGEDEVIWSLYCITFTL